MPIAARELLTRKEAGIPRETLDELRNWRRAQAVFSLNLTAEMFHLLDHFRDSGIAALVIKGPVLSVRGYGDPGTRQYGDLDLIVRDKDILRVTELMAGVGYRASIPVSAIQEKKAPGEYNFRQSSSNLLVEFHTERTFRYHPRPLPLENLFERQARVRFDSGEVPALSPEDELVLICVHGTKHFWERLSYIADVAAFISRQELDWPKVDAAAAEVGAQRMLDVGLRLAHEVLGAPLPDAIQARLRSAPAAMTKLVSRIRRRLPAAASTPRGVFERAVFRVRMHGRGLGGFAYLLRLSFSPTEEDWHAEGQHKRSWLFDALARPFRLARKYGGNKP